MLFLSARAFFVLQSERGEDGGYHNLHKVHSNPGAKAPDTGAVLKYACDSAWGFMKLTIDKSKISGVSFEVDKTGRFKQGNAFSYSAAPMRLADPKSVPTL